MLDLKKDSLTTHSDSQVDSNTSPTAKSEAPRFAERHYTVAEVADLWNLSEDCVRRIFEREPGVLVLGEAKPTRYKRRYRTLRIPEFVLDRVHRRLSRV